MPFIDEIPNGVRAKSQWIRDKNNLTFFFPLPLVVLSFVLRTLPALGTFIDHKKPICMFICDAMCAAHTGAKRKTKRSTRFGKQTKIQA